MKPTKGLVKVFHLVQPTSTIGLQSFELRQTSHHPDLFPCSREGFFGKPVSVQQQQMLQDGYVSSNSKLQKCLPTRTFPGEELQVFGACTGPSNEFCSLDAKAKWGRKAQIVEEAVGRGNNCSGSLKKPFWPLSSSWNCRREKTKLLRCWKRLTEGTSTLPNR